MKTTQKLFLCAALVLTALAIGCAKPPTEEMNNATEAVTRAENDNNAVTYAGNSIARAKDSLARMNDEASAKRYDAARSYAADAIAAADRAITEGRSAAARYRDDASNMISQLNVLAEETEQGLNAARSAKLPLDFETLDEEFDTASSFQDKAQAAFSGNRYQDSLNQGQIARSGFNDINQQLSTSAMAVTRKK